MKVLKTILIFAMAWGPINSLAEDLSATSEMKMDNSLPNNKVTDGVDADDVITNPNLRASSGSKSKWSISNIINYDGGSVSNPFGQQQPNPAGGSGLSKDTDINDQINVKYNLNSLNSIMVGFGVRKVAPFSASGPDNNFRDQGGKDLDMYDPALTYQLLYRVGKLESVFQAILTQYTRSDFVSAKGQNWSRGFGINQQSIAAVGAGFSIGAYIFMNGNSPTDRSQEYSRFQYGLDPYFEYEISKFFTFVNYFNFWNYEQYAQAGFFHDNVTYNTGIEIKISRDFMVQPNIYFDPSNAVARNTSFGILTNLNLF